MSGGSLSLGLTWLLFSVTYFGLAVGRLPGLRIDRAGIAVVGAAAMLAAGLLSLPDAARAVDYQTIILLFAMMVVVAHLDLAGFFACDRRGCWPNIAAVRDACWP